MSPRGLAGRGSGWGGEVHTQAGPRAPTATPKGQNTEPVRPPGPLSRDGGIPFVLCRGIVTHAHIHIYIYIYTSCARAWALTQTKNPIMSICELTHIIAKPVNVQVNVWTRFAWGLIRLARFAQRESLGPIPWPGSPGSIRSARFAKGPIRLARCTWNRAQPYDSIYTYIYVYIYR